MNPFLWVTILCIGLSALLPQELAIGQDTESKANQEQKQDKKEESDAEPATRPTQQVQEGSEEAEAAQSPPEGEARGRRGRGMRGRGQGRSSQGRRQATGGSPTAANRNASPTATGSNRPSRQTFPDAWMDQVTFQSLGPANMSGRIPALAVYEKDPTIWWAASASGGLLKTTNDGYSFEHQFDDQSVVSIGDVQVFPGDSNIVWVGTGEANPRNSVSWGNGVYRSDDGGQTWKHLGLDKTFQTGRIALHPTDSQTAYVGSLGRLWGDNPERGVYKTTDGGENWEKILFIDDKTGIIDLQMHPTNPEILVAAAYERQRDGFDGNDPGKKFGPGSGIYQTTDGGKNWEKISAGLPTCNLGRIGLNWSRSNPDHIFAIVESEKIGGGPEKLPSLGVRSENADAGVRVTDIQNQSNASGILEAEDIILQVDGKLILDSDELSTAINFKKVDDEIELLIVRDGEKENVKVKLGEARQRRSPRGSEANRPFAASLGGQQENRQGQQGENEFEYGGLFKSVDAGKTWERVNSINPRPMYYSQVRVDPTDENNIYILGTSLYKSSDGGVTFTDDGHGSEVHVDHHSLWIDPRDSRHIILGNDGGIYVTRDRMKSWDHLNHVAIGQFYHVGLDATEDYKVYGGLQDNGSWGGPRRSGYGGVINSDWIRIGGGDGFVCLVDPEDPDQLYSESQNGAMGSYNLRTGQRGSIRPRAPRGTRYRFNWKTPFILSPHNSKIHYSAGNHVFRSLYKGNSVAAISPEITNTDSGAGSAISESAVEAGVIYVGTTDGAVWMTKDGGQNWEPIFSQPEEKKEEAENAGEESESSQDDADASEAESSESKQQEEAADSEMDNAPVQDPDTVAGSWVGSFESSDGQIAGDFEMELTLGEDNVVIGDITTEEGTAAINNGIYDREQKSLTFAVETPMGEITPTFVMKDQKLVAEIQLPEGVILKIEATRKADKGTRRIFTAMQEKTEADSDKSATTDKSESDKPDSVNKAIVDSVAGSWSGQMLRDGQVMSQFSMQLKVAADGKVTGSYDTDRGNGEVLDGKFDIATQQLTLPIDTGRMEAVITGNVKGNDLTGEMDFGGGRFVVNVTAERTGTAAPISSKNNSTETSALGELVPGPRWVSSLEASKHQRGRCYISLDGHRSDDDGLYIFASEDYGKTWRSIRANLPDTAGSARVLREDIANPDVLYLGCEFSAWLSIDRGKSWTKFSGLPTVAVHEFAQHPTNGEIVVGTHGRSLWVFDASMIRQMNNEALSHNAHLFEPAELIRWRQMPERGSNSTRSFTTEATNSEARIFYTLKRPARSVVVSIEDIEGREVFRSEGETGSGLQEVTWDLRRGGSNQGGRRFRGAAVAAGQYRIELQVNDDLYHQVLTVKNDPNFETPENGREEDLWSEIEELMGEED